MGKLISRKEYEDLVANLPEGYCPFCKVENQIVLGDSEYWVWIAALSPYWRYHTLLVPRRHMLDISDISADEFKDLKKLYGEIVKHLLTLNLKHEDGKTLNQFIFMIRTREKEFQDDSAYYKPDHLHIHISPDREGVGRFNLDEFAIDVDIEKIAFKHNKF
ncbi:MAG: HIT domain-containing protein [bacterium]|nr:HIT domain-containing protein [bacterium]